MRQFFVGRNSANSVTYKARVKLTFFRVYTSLAYKPEQGILFEKDSPDSEFQFLCGKDHNLKLEDACAMVNASQACIDYCLFVKNSISPDMGRKVGRKFQFSPEQFELFFFALFLRIQVASLLSMAVDPVNALSDEGRARSLLPVCKRPPFKKTTNHSETADEMCWTRIFTGKTIPIVFYTYLD